MKALQGSSTMFAPCSSKKKSRTTTTSHIAEMKSGTCTFSVPNFCCHRCYFCTNTILLIWTCRFSPYGACGHLPNLSTHQPCLCLATSTKTLLLWFTPHLSSMCHWCLISDSWYVLPTDTLITFHVTLPFTSCHVTWAFTISCLLCGVLPIVGLGWAVWWWSG